MLAEAAKEDPDRDVREAAVKKLTDQALIADLAENDSEYEIRIAAIERLTDQAVLEKIARKLGPYSKYAIKRLTDMTVLEEITVSEIKTDRPIYEYCEKRSNHEKAVKAAAIRLIQSAMPEYAVYENEKDFEDAMLKKCSDPDWLSELSPKALEYVIKYLSCPEPCPAPVSNAIIDLYRRGVRTETIDKYSPSLKARPKHKHADGPARCEDEHEDRLYVIGYCSLDKYLSGLNTGDEHNTD